MYILKFEIRCRLTARLSVVVPEVADFKIGKSGGPLGCLVAVVVLEATVTLVILSDLLWGFPPMLHLCLDWVCRRSDWGIVLRDKRRALHLIYKCFHF